MAGQKSCIEKATLVVVGYNRCGLFLHLRPDFLHVSCWRMDNVTGAR